MNKFDFISVLRAYCNTNGIYFIMGENAYVNAVADYTTYENNELILLCDLRLGVTFGGSVVQGVTYNGIIALGRKREFDSTTQVQTESSLDETMEQKYDRRLQYLSEQLCNILKEITCNNDGSIESLSIRYDINQFDLNADFVAGDVSISF